METNLPDELESAEDFTDPEVLADLEPDTSSKWPKVIGIISLVYAMLGLLCNPFMIGSTMLGEWLASMGGMDLTIPASVKYPALVVYGLAFCLGLLMLSGAIGLIRRRRSGVSRLRKWAMLRLSLLVLGLGVTMFTLPGQLDLQRQGIEFGNRQWRESGRPDRVQEFDEDEQWFNVIRNTAIATAAFAAYPLFIGFYMSRRKITDQVENWM